MNDFSSLRGFLDSFLDTGLPGFDCAVFHKGKCVMRHAGGYSCVEQKIPVLGTELYNIYSCSKTITVVAAMLLYEEGRLSLEDKLANYIYEFSFFYAQHAIGSPNNRSNQITQKIRDILDA